MKFEEVKDKLGTWADLLKDFVETEEFDKIYERLQKDSLRGRKICPSSDDTFRAFAECDYRNLRCVLVGMSPYHQVRDTKDGEVCVADGLMMSCSNTGILQPSLEMFYNGIEDELYNGLNLKMVRNPDLRYLAHQGVLLVNSSLTTEKGKPDAHSGLWTGFMTFLLEQLNMYDRGIPFVFMGQEAQKLSKVVVPFHHYVFEISHPASASYKGTKWDTLGVFGKINTILEQNNGPEFKINWVQEKV